MSITQPADSAPVQIDQKIEFYGTGKEYFGIWIVNLILSIVTLGIYSAWAKVSRETYFKNNTKILGRGFGYHADPKRILKGRIIAYVVVVILAITPIASLFINVVIAAIFLSLFPWLINNSMRFSAHMTSYRNVRFGWHGTYKKTLWFLIIGPILGLFSLGLLMPIASKNYYSYFASSHSYGTTRFTSKSKVSEYYFALFFGGVVPIIMFLVFTGLFFAPSAQNSGEDGDYSEIFYALYISVFLVPLTYRVLCRNVMIRNLSLSDVVTFDSKLNPLRVVWLSLSNIVAIVFSLGLLLPWAKVRMHSYLAKSIEIKINGDIEKFIGDTLDSPSYFGEEYAESEEIEVVI